MTFILRFSKQAQKDIQFHKKSGNKSRLKKLHILLTELSVHPTSGTGKPEKLKHELSGLWSRRVDKEHRLVYEIIEDVVKVHAAKGHYF